MHVCVGVGVPSVMTVFFVSFPQNKLGKSVNMRAMTMLGKAEEKVGCTM